MLDFGLICDRCDRQEPCEACVKSHMEACVYKDGHRLAQRPTVFGGSSQPSEAQAAISTSLQSSAPRAPIPHQIPTPAITMASASQHSPRQASRPVSTNDPSLSQPEPGQVHVNPHEIPICKRLAEARVVGMDALFPTPFGQMRGIFAKNRFYGESHWMCYLHKVRSFPFRPFGTSWPN